MSYEPVDFGTPARLHDRSWSAVEVTPPANAGRVADGATRRSHLTLVPDDFVFPPETPDEQWQERALCAQTDPEAFFPEKGGSTREAKRICMGCEVRDACLEYALAHDERFGIWGGLSERERRRLKRGII
jgi:WhiB family transcriptional regulator, redox-sensing transcriptional regulator